MIIDIGIECPDIVYMYTVTSQASWSVLCTGKTGDTLLTAHVMTGREEQLTPDMKSVALTGPAPAPPARPAPAPVAPAAPGPWARPPPGVTAGPVVGSSPRRAASLSAAASSNFKWEIKVTATLQYLLLVLLLLWWALLDLDLDTTVLLISGAGELPCSLTSPELLRLLMGDILLKYWGHSVSALVTFISLSLPVTSPWSTKCQNDAAVILLSTIWYLLSTVTSTYNCIKWMFLLSESTQLITHRNRRVLHCTSVMHTNCNQSSYQNVWFIL